MQKRAHACKCVEEMGSVYKRDAYSHLTPIRQIRQYVDVLQV